MDSSSSSSSSSSASGPPSEKCQICFQQGHGIHFGAFTCRACAAFFRRCHFSPNFNKKCRAFNEKCVPHPINGRWFCKKCRLARCKESGMTTYNIQYDRDAFKSSEVFVRNQALSKRKGDRERDPKKNETVKLVSHLVSFFQREFNEDGQIAFVDMSSLIEKATCTILHPNIVKRSRHMLSNLEQLTEGLKDFQSSQKETTSELAVITQSIQKSDWERSMCSTAKWLMSSEYIKNMDASFKVDLLRSIWFIVGKLERVAMTAKMRLNRQCGQRQFAISPECLLDLDTMSTDISWWSPYSFEDLGFFFIPSEVFYDQVILELMEVQPDNIELTFLLCVISFELAANHNRGAFQEKMEKFQDVLSNDLHQYYVQNKKSMYSLRLKKLMRVKEHFMNQRMKRAEKFAVGQCLNMFQIEFSNPSFFYIPC